MKALFINGSPRKNINTAQVQNAFELGKRLVEKAKNQ